MNIKQYDITLSARTRGFHIITDEILRNIPDIKDVNAGIAHIFIKHTSASLSINENADPDVRGDLERHFNKLAPENSPHFEHTIEGPDDMPAHIKASLLGSSVTVPIKHGTFNLGTWQGIYLCEHRNRGGSRHLVVTIFGS